MKDKFAKFFAGLKPQHKGVVVALITGVCLMILGAMTYFSQSRADKAAAEKAAVDPAKKGKVVNMDNNLMTSDQLLTARSEAAAAQEAAKAKEKELEALRLGKPSQPTAGTNNKGSESLPVPAATGPSKLPPPPPPLAAQQGGFPANTPMPINAAPSMPASMEIGGISVTNFADTTTAAAKKDDDKKKDEKRSVYLPISYMEATLLSGLDAPTATEAKGNPVPVLIRVKTPAVLPNDVKANLRGCFVVADGKGNLGTERAELVLVTLSCLDRKGQAVIDQPLTGYVVDADGKAGLKGRVVTKMGAMITRSMVAGMFGGFGEALNNANTTTSITPIGGSISNIEPSQIGMAGLGKGLSNAFKEIQKFYMELAHQTLPVIEIGAARPITLVVTKGVNIDIKKLRSGGK